MKEQIGNYLILFRPEYELVQAITVRTEKRLIKHGPPKYVRDFINAHRKYQGYLYLIHFKKPYKHARHYLGFTRDVRLRELRHISGQGANLVRVIQEAGIEWKIVKLWYGDRYLERRLKKTNNVPRYCPVCRGEVTYEGVTYEQVLEKIQD